MRKMLDHPHIKTPPLNPLQSEYLFLYCVIVLVGLCGLYHSILSSLWDTWMEQDQYSYAVLIPLIFVYLIKERWGLISSSKIRQNLLGLVIVFAGYLFFLFGTFGFHGFTSRFSFLIMLSGFMLYGVGWEVFKRLLFPLFILLFMIPFPELLDRIFLFKLRLISSALTEQLLHLLGISVFSQGNIIDIGIMQFNVVNACSGMNYLLPLLCLSIIIGYFFSKSLWVRLFLFISAIPTTLVINVIRITATAIIADYWTREIATGFMHAFSGWLLFMLGFVLLFIESNILTRFFKQKPNPTLRNKPTQKIERKYVNKSIGALPIIVTVCLFAIFIGGYYAIASRKANFPIPNLSDLPLTIDGYKGKTVPEDPGIKAFSSVTDSITRVYTNNETNPIAVYIGYYRTTPKLKGFIHTPEVCLESTGWKVKEINNRELRVADNSSMINCRLVFSERFGIKQVLVYWYQIGDFTTGHERLAHLYTGYDAIFGNYDDAVKIMISKDYIHASEREKSFQELVSFVRAFYPCLVNTMKSSDN